MPRWVDGSVGKGWESGRKVSSQNGGEERLGGVDRQVGRRETESGRNVTSEDGGGRKQERQESRKKIVEN